MFSGGQKVGGSNPLSPTIKSLIFLGICGFFRGLTPDENFQNLSSFPTKYPPFPIAFPIRVGVCLLIGVCLLNRPIVSFPTERPDKDEDRATMARYRIDPRSKARVEKATENSDASRYQRQEKVKNFPKNAV